MPRWIPSPTSIVAVSRQIRGFIAENRESFTPTLDRLNGVLAIIDNRRERLQDAVKRLNSYAMALGESVSSVRSSKGFVVNLPPGQYIQPFIDAAFSDLGLDPNVLAPSSAHRPASRATGHPGDACALPSYRAGRSTADDGARCDYRESGRPGVRAAGSAAARPTGCYPYREPIPAPAPGGPPRGRRPPRHLAGSAHTWTGIRPGAR